METTLYLNSLQTRGIKPGLERISKLLELMGNPQKSFPSVIIGGTNGKGSTTEFLSCILHEAGLKVGSYTSPHLLKFNERIRIDGNKIEDETIDDLTVHIKIKLDAYNSYSRLKDKIMPTFFEFTTAMAFEYFKLSTIDIGVLEIGLGGRFDAVNIADPYLSVITNVAIDHIDFLGNTLKKITFEKAGIIKKNRPTVLGETNPHTVNIISDIAGIIHAPVRKIGKDFLFTVNSDSSFNYISEKLALNNLRLSIKGDFQYSNAACAIKACETLIQKYELNIPEKSIRDGLLKTKIPGRLEEVKHKSLNVILDGAHNPAATKEIGLYLSKNYKKKQLTVMLGIMKNKDYAQIVKSYVPVCERIILVKPEIERSWNLSTMEKVRNFAPDKIIIIPCISDALEWGKMNLSKGDTLCITGSIFTVAEAKKSLNQ